MTSDDDARPPQGQILATIVAGLLAYLVFRLMLGADPIAAGGIAFAAAQLAAELFPPNDDDDPPGGESTTEEISPRVS